MRRRFEACYARLQVGDGVFERALDLFERPHAAVEFCVRGLNHRLCVGGGALDCRFYGIDSPLDLLVDRDDGFGEGVEPLFKSLGGDFKVPTRLGVSRGVLLPHPARASGPRLW